MVLTDPRQDALRYAFRRLAHQSTIGPTWLLTPYQTKTSFIVPGRPLSLRMARPVLKLNQDRCASILIAPRLVRQPRALGATPKPKPSVALIPISLAASSGRAFRWRCILANRVLYKPNPLRPEGGTRKAAFWLLRLGMGVHDKA